MGDTCRYFTYYINMLYLAGFSLLNFCIGDILKIMATKIILLFLSKIGKVLFQIVYFLELPLFELNLPSFSIFKILMYFPKDFFF